MKKALKKPETLKSKAKENTTVVVTRAGRPKTTTTIKQGVAVDPTHKHDPNSTAAPIVGMSKGVTKNMGDFESLRVDVWLTDTVHSGETIEEAYQRVDAIVTETLEDAISNSISE